MVFEWGEKEITKEGRRQERARGVWKIVRVQRSQVDLSQERGRQDVVKKVTKVQRQTSHQGTKTRLLF